MKKLPFPLIVLIGLVYWPIAVPISIVWGAVGGVIFKAIANYEDFWFLAIQEIQEWKRYPWRHHRKFIDRQEEFQIGYANSIHGTPLSREALESKYTKAPFPYGSLILNFYICTCFLPFRCIAGFCEGPFIALSDTLYIWRKYILKIYPNIKYQRLLDMVRNKRQYEDFKTAFNDTLLLGGF